jgi:hypothetical protein
MPRPKVFVSYSHSDKKFRDELVPVLQAVPGIGEVLWFDEQDITIGDEFHPQIQQALAASRIGILLLSNRFFTSNYIKRHELPYLLQRASGKTLKIAPLYVTTIPDGAFKVTIEVDGQQRPVNLKDYLGVHSPNEPLNTLNRGERDKVYARLADWVAQQLAVTTDLVLRPTGPRFELAISLRARDDHWEHRFSLPHAANFARPALNCPTPEVLFSYPAYTVDGEDLFQVLFGSDVQTSGEILGAAFGGVPMADPTRYPLRIRLLTDREDDRLCALPWATIAYQGRRLTNDGWTVELHHDSHPGFPEYPPHTCYFPGKVVLIGASAGGQTPQDIAHLQDVQHFFQRRWQQAPEPMLVRTNAELRAALRIGSTRLVYYYGEASPDGLLVEGAERSFT